MIRELIQTGRTPIPNEIQQIRERMAIAPFNPGMIRVDRRMRGKRYQSIVLGRIASAADYHLVKRVGDERQWADGTTFAQYFADLESIPGVANSRLAWYYRDEHTVIATASTMDVVSAEWRGDLLKPLILVVYSADRGVILTGYQFIDLAKVDLPEGIQWYK